MRFRDSGGTRIMAHKLTAARIRKLRFNKDGPIKQVHSDQTLPAFGVRVYQSGRKAYVLRYGPTRRLVTMAPCTTGEDVDELREAAQGMLRQHGLTGDSPKAAMRRSAASTIKRTVEAYIESRSRDWSAGEVKRAKGRLKHHIEPYIGDVALAALTRPECREMHAKASKRAKIEANRALELLHASVEWALSDGLVRAVDLNEGENPARRIRKNPEKPRREWVRPDELPALMRAIDAEDNPWMRAFFRMAFYTGARKGELLGLTWDNVDLKNGVVRFLDTKNKTDHEVPLAPDAVAVLRDLPRMVGNPYVFCGRRAGQPINHPYKAWQRILDEAGIERRITLHDIRRTVGSMLATQGVSTQQIGKLLNHKSHVTAQVYAEIADTAKRDMAETMARLLK